MTSVAQKRQQPTAMSEGVIFNGTNARTTCDAVALTPGEKTSLFKMPLSRNMAVPAIEPIDDIRSGK